MNQPHLRLKGTNPTKTKNTLKLNLNLAFPSGGRGTALAVDELSPNTSALNNRIWENRDGGPFA